MHIRLNTFDYESLTAALLSILGEDIPLTRELITKTLNDLIGKIEAFAPVLSPDVPMEIVEYVNDKLMGLEAELLSADEIWGLISDSLYVAGKEKPEDRGQLFNIFAAKFGIMEDAEGAYVQMDSEQGIELLNLAYNYIDQCRGEFLSPEQYLIKVSLYDQLKDSELMQVKFKILDVDGTQVKYGNNLITFPVILAEVF